MKVIRKCPYTLKTLDSYDDIVVLTCKHMYHKSLFDHLPLESFKCAVVGCSYKESLHILNGQERLDIINQSFSTEPIDLDVDDHTDTSLTAEQVYKRLIDGIYSDYLESSTNKKISQISKQRNKSSDVKILRRDPICKACKKPIKGNHRRIPFDKITQEGTLVHSYKTVCL